MTSPIASIFVFYSLCMSSQDRQKKYEYSKICKIRTNLEENLWRNYHFACLSNYLCDSTCIYGVTHSLLHTNNHAHIRYVRKYLKIFIRDNAVKIFPKKISISKSLFVMMGKKDFPKE